MKSVSLYEGDWKLLVMADGTGAQLYDLASDPGESRNLAERHRKRVAHLTKLVLDWRKTLP